jgi:hypothetical protein
MISYREKELDNNETLLDTKQALTNKLGERR